MASRRLRALLLTPVSGRRWRTTAVLAGFLAAAGLGNCIGHSAEDPDRPWPTRTRSVDPRVRGEAGTEKVIFIVIDALRRDHLGANGYARPTSPTIDRLASEGLLFARTVVHASQTVPSMLSILTSKLPSEHGVQYDSASGSFGPDGLTAAPVVDEGLVLMAEIFAGAGFHTAAIVANPWLRRAHGFAQGYAEYTELDGGDGRDVTALARQTLLDHRGERAFLYLHYMDVHSPYAGYPSDRRGVPPPFERPEGGRYRYHNGLATGIRAEDLAYTMTLYDEGIYYVDQLISKLLAFLAAEGMDRDATIVVLSDHGDEFMEHGGLGHGTTLHAELIQSFAILWSPRRVEARRFEGCARGIDVLPTLLSLHGIAAPPGLRGVDLLEPGARAACAAETVSELADEKALIAHGWKLVRRVSSGAETFEYVGEDGVPDPGPAPERRPPDAMRHRIGEVIEQASRSRSAPAPLDPADESRLRELGYLR
jgi:arylsulfatase A-like enzyme